MLKRIFIIGFISTICFAYGAVFLPQEFSFKSVGIAQAQSKEENILPKDVITKPGETKPAIPSKNLKKDIVPRMIEIALLLMGTVSFCVFVYSGIMLIIAQGNEEELTKFKTAIVWSLVGLALISSAYALVRGIMALVFK